MDANTQLDYLIHALESLLNGEKINIEEFSAVCKDREAREELKRAFQKEEEGER